MRPLITGLFCLFWIAACTQGTIDLNSESGDSIVTCIVNDPSQVILDIDSISSSAPLPDDTVVVLIADIDQMLLETSPEDTVLAIMYDMDKYYLRSTLNSVPSNPNKCIYRSVRYPVEARRYGIAGTVVIDVLVNESGAIVDTRPLTQIGYGLEEAVESAVMQCAIEPAYFALFPVKSVLRIPVAFNLN